MSRFYTVKPVFLSEIASRSFAEVDFNGLSDVEICGVDTIDKAQQGYITSAHNPKYVSRIKSTRASACIVPADYMPNRSDLIFLKHQSPYYVYAIAINLIYHFLGEDEVGISETSCVSKSAKIGKNVFIGNFVSIGDDVIIGDDTKIFHGSVIGRGCIVGDGCRLHENVSIYHSELGNNVTIFDGARIGSEGFGFATFSGKSLAIKHVGIVSIGNNVRIGSNTTINRGSISNTVISDDCMIDSSVHIGHNVHVGVGSIIAGQVGIAGSVKIGKYCMIGGQVGIADHIEIADYTTIGGKSGVTQSITDTRGMYMGYPAVPIIDFHRQTLVLKNLIKHHR